MMVLRLHFNLRDYKPKVEFDVRPEVSSLTLHDLSGYVRDGALSAVDVEGPDGTLYKIKPRARH